MDSYPFLKLILYHIYFTHSLFQLLMVLQSMISCQGGMFAEHEMEPVRQNVILADKKMELS
jgi:hypothetical protein